MWKLTALCFLTALLPLPALACQPSKVCALERARELAIEHLGTDPHTRYHQFDP